MRSLLAEVLKLKYPPVAILWSDELPAEAHQYVPGRWGCVMAAFGSTAEKGRVAAFARDTFGCWGGGVGLGFGNAYELFPGGTECFCNFLSDGNQKSEKGRTVAEECAAWMRGEMREHFLHGERYRKTPELVDQWIRNLPIKDIPARYVIFKQLGQVTEDEVPKTIVFLANPDQMSALVVMANYAHGDSANAVIPHAAGCQSIGIFTYQEDDSANPRVVVGLNDISARRYLRRLGKDLVTVSMPLPLYRELEADVPGSFLETEQWLALVDANEPAAGKQ